MDKLISVVIPTYNRSQSLLASVNSVLSQTWKNLELIVVDDCSTDNTRDVLSSINDIRLKVYYLSKNRGACYARNFGIKMSSGSYVAFNDSDDIWFPYKLKIQVDALGNDYNCCFCSYLKISGHNVHTIPSKTSKSVFTFYDILRKCSVGNPTLIVKKDLLSNNSVLFDEKLTRFQDWDFALQISILCPILFISEPLVLAGKSPGSISSNRQALIFSLKQIYYNYNKHIKKSVYLYTIWLLRLFKYIKVQDFIRMKK